MATIHIRYAGQSSDLESSDLDIGDLSSDREIKEAIARYFEVPLAKLDIYLVDRSVENDNITVRPEAVFG